MQFFRYPRGQREQGVFFRFVNLFATFSLNYFLKII